MNYVSDIPIYIQIVEEFKIRVLIGTYKSGEKLPTIRVLADEMGVNINTIQRALFEVDKLGIINYGKGNVRYVTNDTIAINKIKESLKELYLNNFLNKIHKLGLSFNEIEKYIECR